MRASCSVTVMASTSSSCPAATSGWEKSPNATGRWESLTRHCPRAPSASIQRTRTEVGCPSANDCLGCRVGVRQGRAILDPARAAWDLVAVAAVAVLARDVGHLAQEVVLEGDRLEAEVEELSVLGDEVVAGGLLARVVEQVDVRSGDSGDQLGEVDDSVYLGHLVEDPDARAARRRVLDGELDAADACPGGG